MPTDSISRRGFVGIAAPGVAGAALPDLATPPVRRALAPPRLIVRGDDMGYAHAGNDAIITASFSRSVAGVLGERIAAAMAPGR